MHLELGESTVRELKIYNFSFAYIYLCIKKFKVMMLNDFGYRLYIIFSVICSFEVLSR